MSVINKMLQDLDKRQQASSQQPSSQLEYAGEGTSGLKRQWLLLALVVILSIALVITGWKLWSQAAPILESPSSPVASETKIVHRDENGPEAKGALELKNASDLKSASDPKENPDLKETSVVKDNVELKGDTHLKNTAAANNNQIDDEQAGSKLATTNSAPIAAENSQDISTQVTQSVSKQTQPSIQKKAESHRSEPVVTNSVKTEHESSTSSTAQSAQPAGSFNIEAVTMTKSQLMANKQQQLNQAKSNKQLDKALAIAKDLHLLAPRNLEYIQEFAALSYAKGHFKDAERVLMSGMAIEEVEEDERKLAVMLARMYYKVKNYQQAYQVLLKANPPVTINQDYYALRAILAQELEDVQQAFADYQSLTLVAENSHQWWLGFAISADKLEKYAIAYDAYKKVMTFSNLGASSRDFVRQRLQVLAQ